MFNIDKSAKEIASKANECCNRGDGYEEAIEALALQKLKEAYNAAIEEAALKVAEKIKYPTEACAIIRSLKK